jgi:hypothetical protein
MSRAESPPPDELARIKQPLRLLQADLGFVPTRRRAWLVEHDADEGHVAVDPDGTEYIIVPLDSGGEMRVDLPADLQ